jgi:GAF domain-containing protein/HAMP domain-containing protein
MTTDVDSSSPENKFTGSLTRKTILSILPAAFLPIIISIVDIAILSTFSNPIRVAGILIIGLVIGLIYTFLLNKFIKIRILKPVEKLTDTTRRFALGDLKERTHLQQDDEIGLLAYYIEKMGDILNERFNTLEVELNTRDHQLRFTSELSQIFASDTLPEHSFQKIVNMITERFNQYQASIYLLNKNSDQAVLKAVSGGSGNILGKAGDTVPIPVSSSFGWVVEHNKPRVYPFQEKESLSSSETEITVWKTAAVIPISSGDNVLGILLIQKQGQNEYKQQEISTLCTIANQIAASYINPRPPEKISSIQDGASLLYQSSHTIITAKTELEVFAGLKNTLKQLPYAVALFDVEQDKLNTLYRTDRFGHPMEDSALPELSVTPFSTHELIQRPYPITFAGSQDFESLPGSIRLICNDLQFNSLILYPIVVNGKLSGLLFMGSTQEGILNQKEVDYLHSLFEITVTSLEKVDALRTITEQLNELKTLNTVSQSISTETHLMTLYQVVHQQIVQVMDAVNFLIALYIEPDRTIEIPYMDDGDQIISVPPFPLGQGLTSIIIRTRQPLMIVEDTINRSRALGAIVTGDKPALSWLGVPMILGGEILGAIVVQDLEREHRFDENDMRLLTTLAAQVAIAIHNTQLIETAQLRAERDRQLYEITDKIRRAVDIQGVLETTARELSVALDARRTQVEISPEPISNQFNDNGQNDWKDPLE